MAIKLYEFLDVSGGLQADQFGIGARRELASLDDLDPLYKRLLDERRVLFECRVDKVSTFGQP